MAEQRQGSLFSATAARFGITERQVSRLVAKDRQIGNIKDLPRSERPKVTTEREDGNRTALQKASFEASTTNQRRLQRRGW